LAPAAEQRVCLGAIAGVHGVKGAVRLKSFTAAPKDIASYGALEHARGDRRFEIALVGASRGALIARIAGIDDRNAAERLKGERLYISRERLPPPGEEEFYLADLVGLAARLSDGTELGRVGAVHDYGAGASLEIVRAGEPSLLLPFNRSTVPVVDVAGGSITVTPPEGLVEGAAR
jgi:16S rRNA processing protein RimM